MRQVEERGNKASNICTQILGGLFFAPNRLSSVKDDF